MDSVGLVTGLGGVDNIRGVEGAHNRLRCEIRDLRRVDAAAIREAGAIGVVRQTHSVQIIIDSAVDDILAAIRAHIPGTAERADAPASENLPAHG